MSATQPQRQLRLPLKGDSDREGAAPVELPPVTAEDLERLHRTLAEELGEPIDLVGTGNRRSILSCQRSDSGILQVRVQRQFALGGEAVAISLARWIRDQDPAARRLLHDYAATFQAQMPPPRPRFAHPAGTHHDLREHLEEQNRLWFDGSFRGRIGWSRMNRGQVRRRIRLGSWSEHHQLIRVHPVLDSAEVPRYVIAFIVFHEMLHANLGAEKKGNRRSVHGAQFRDLEASHPDHDRAEEWIEEMSDSLLSY